MVEDVKDEDEHRPVGAPVEIDLDELDIPDKDTEAGKGSQQWEPREEGEI